MKVVNLRQSAYTVYIGRSGKGLDGYWGNPVKLNSQCHICLQVHESRGSTLACYEVYLRNKLQKSAIFRKRFLDLQEDDILGCFCKPDACHGDIIVKIWTELNSFQKKI